jgi:hypothetical protein
MGTPMFYCLVKEVDSAVAAIDRFDLDSTDPISLEQFHGLEEELKEAERHLVNYVRSKKKEKAMELGVWDGVLPVLMLMGCVALGKYIGTR